MIIVLTGENEVLRQAELTRMVDEFVAQHTDMAVERLDGEEVGYARMHEAVQSLPFLVSRKMVLLRSPSVDKEFTEQFEQFEADVAETNDVIIVEPKLDKRVSYYKQLKKMTDFREFALLDGPSLVRYLTDYARKGGGSLSIGDAQLLVDRVGANQLMLHHELDKLLAYNPKITRSSIELLTERTPHSSVFELLDAAFTGDVKRAMRLYDEQRDMRVEPQQIIAMLVWQLHVLAIIKAANSRSADLIAKEARLSPYVVRKSVELARRITSSRLKALVSGLRTFDVRLKSEAVNADEVVRYYLMTLASI